MAANGRGNMRPTNRSPPFLAIGLFVALVILGFNYWNLSVKNGEQFNEISVMERELKIVSAKKGAVEKRADAIQDKVKYLEDELNKQKGYVSEKAAALASAQNERESAVHGKAELQTEFDVMKEKLPLCQKEVEGLRQMLEETKAELERKKNEQLPTLSCGASECAQFVDSTRDSVLDEVLQYAGPAALATLYKNGRNVGKFADQLKGIIANQPNYAGVAQQQLVPGGTNVVGQQQGMQNQVPQGQNVEARQPDQTNKVAEGNQQVVAGDQQQAEGGAQPRPQVPAAQVGAPIIGGVDQNAVTTNNTDALVSVTKHAKSLVTTTTTATTTTTSSPSLLTTKSIKTMKDDETNKNDGGTKLSEHAKDEEVQPKDHEQDVKIEDNKIAENPDNKDVKADQVPPPKLEKQSTLDQPPVDAADDKDADDDDNDGADPAADDNKSPGVGAGDGAADDDGDDDYDDADDANPDVLKVGDDKDKGDDYNYDDDDDDDQDIEGGLDDDYDDDENAKEVEKEDKGIENMKMEMDKQNF